MAKTTKQLETTAWQSDLPVIISARTGLAGKDDAILRKVPAEYSGKSVREALDYIVKGQLTDNELSLADSLKRELQAPGVIILANGKQASMNDSLDKYLIQKEHKLPNGDKKTYGELEIEISAVQQGGFY